MRPPGPQGPVPPRLWATRTSPAPPPRSSQLTGPAAAAAAASLRKLAASREPGEPVTVASLPPGGAANQRRDPARPSGPEQPALGGLPLRASSAGRGACGRAGLRSPGPTAPSCRGVFSGGPVRRDRLALHGVLWKGRLGCDLLKTPRSSFLSDRHGPDSPWDLPRGAPPSAESPSFSPSPLSPSPRPREGPLVR